MYVIVAEGPSNDALVAKFLHIRSHSLLNWTVAGFSVAGLVSGDLFAYFVGYMMRLEFGCEGFVCELAVFGVE